MKLFKLTQKIVTSSLFIKSSIAFLDQSFLSGVNFLVTIILIKTVSKGEYGYYSIAFAISLFLVSVQNAIVTTPLSVLLAAKKSDEKQNYVRTLCWGQFIAILPAVVIGLILIGMLYHLGLDGIKTSIAMGLCLASAGILLREFGRAYHYAEQLPQSVLKLDLCYITLYFSLIALTTYIFKLSVALIFIFMGLSGAIAFMIFCYHKLPINLNRNLIKESFAENWKLGKWAILGVVTTHIQRYSHLYILGALIGSDAVADVSASRLLFMPFLLIEIGWGKVTIPHGSILRENKRLNRYFKELIVISLGLGLAIFLYATLISLFSGQLEKYLYTEKYASAFNFVFLWAAIFAIDWIKANASFGLQVVKKFESLAKINIFTMIITVLSTYLFIKLFGIKGALFAILLGEVIFAFILWWVLTTHILLIKPDTSTNNSIRKILKMDFMT